MAAITEVEAQAREDEIRCRITQLLLSGAFDSTILVRGVKRATS